MLLNNESQACGVVNLIYFAIEGFHGTVLGHIFLGIDTHLPLSRTLNAELGLAFDHVGHQRKPFALAKARAVSRNVVYALGRTSNWLAVEKNSNLIRSPTRTSLKSVSGIISRP